MSEATPERPAPEAAADAAPMRCPKCGAEMRTHQRNGVTIEQCRKCHGIFLDRGELEQLIGRESSFFGGDGELRGDDAAARGLRFPRWRR
jgi:Zn-finger nucleic acid-binding protein